jgi:hypothetical protein
MEEQKCKRFVFTTFTMEYTLVLEEPTYYQVAVYKFCELSGLTADAIMMGIGYIE